MPTFDLGTDLALRLQVVSGPAPADAEPAVAPPAQARPAPRAAEQAYPIARASGRLEALLLSRTFWRLAENRVRFVDDAKRRKQQLKQIRRETEEMPFKPQINSHSAKIARQQSEQLLRDLRGVISSADHTEILLQKGLKTKERLRTRVEMKREKGEEECTFKPYTNNYVAEPTESKSS